MKEFEPAKEKPRLEPGPGDVILKRQKNGRPSVRRPASSEQQNVSSGPDPLFFDEAEGILLRRTIDIKAWSRGESSPPDLAIKFKATGRLLELPGHQKMERIGVELAKLREKIVSSPLLKRDFEFFLDKMGWFPETLLYYLYWDSDMMDFSSPTIVSRDKKRKWSTDRKDLQQMLKRIMVPAVQIERLSERLNPADEEYCPRQFRESLSNFVGSVRDLLQKLSHAEALWRLRRKRWESVVRKARRTSFYEQIRATTGRHHADRLHRLVNAARNVQEIPPIEKHAFTIWLNRLKSAM